MSTGNITSLILCQIPEGRMPVSPSTLSPKMRNCYLRDLRESQALHDSGSRVREVSLSLADYSLEYFENRRSGRL